MRLIGSYDIQDIRNTFQGFFRFEQVQDSTKPQGVYIIFEAHEFALIAIPASSSSLARFYFAVRDPSQTTNDYTIVANFREIWRIL